MNSLMILPLFALPGVLNVDTAFGSDVIQMILHAGLVVKFVMFVLFIFSITSWMIIFMKWRLFRRASQETAYFLDLFWESKEWSKINTECEDLFFSPIARLFQSGYSELRRIRKIQTQPVSND